MAEIQTVSTKTNIFVQTTLADSVTGIVECWLWCEGVLYSYVTAEKKRRRYEGVHVCMYVRVTLILHHIPLLTLEGMIVPFLVVPTAAETRSTHSVRLEPPT